MGGMTRTAQSKQSQETQNMEFSCGGGVLFTLLLIVMTSIVYSSELVLIQFHAETYNGKATGLSLNILKYLLENNGSLNEKAKALTEDLYKKGFIQSSFVIVRFVHALKHILNKKDFSFTWGIGSIINGKLDNDHIPLIEYDVIKLNKSFYNLRNGKTKLVFVDQFSKEKENRYKHYLFEKVRGKIDFFHPFCGMLPIRTFMNVYNERINKYFEKTNNSSAYESLNQFKSVPIKVQQYLQQIR